MNILELNPYYKKFNELLGEDNKLLQSQKEISDSLKRYLEINIDTLNGNMRNLQIKEEELLREINYLNISIRKESSIIKEITKKIGSNFNPLNWFNKEQSSLKSDLDSHNEILEKGKTLLASKQSLLFSFESKKKILSSNIMQYKAFDYEAKSNELENVSKLLATLVIEINKVALKKEAIDDKIQPVIAECITPKLNDISKAREDIKILEEYKNRLNNAYSSYDRAIVHQECEEKFGEGKPDKLLSTRHRIIDSAQRAINKAVVRINDLVSNGEKVAGFKELILDGNNMCYHSTSSKFIGIDLLLDCAAKLAKTYKLSVVFDYSILKHLKMRPEKISKIFEKINAEVNIVQSGTDADDLITTLADSPEKFILSNDKFDDFKERECVAKKRIIRHQIVSPKQMIIDALSLNVKI